MTIEDVLANAAERTTMLRSEGHPVEAASIERVTEEVRTALGEYLTWLSESDAVLYTNRSAEYLRSRFPALEERGLARWVGRQRYFRRCALEHRGNADAARQAGRRAGRGEAA
jgi:hypothetical protein